MEISKDKKRKSLDVPDYKGRSPLESRFIKEIDNGEEKDKLNYCWQMYAKMICLFFGLICVFLIFFTTIIPIRLIYIMDDNAKADAIEAAFPCPWTALCPLLDCHAKCKDQNDCYWKV